MIKTIVTFTQITALAAWLAMSSIGSALAYFADEASWEAALPDWAIVEPFPVSALQVTDSFGTYDYGATSNFAGTLHCLSYIYPCAGAFTYEFTLPSDVIGIVGDLYIGPHYTGSKVTAAPFQLPVQNCLPATPCFNGFYADFFAPTNTLIIDWPAGHSSTDDSLSWSFTNARIVRASEPATLALLGTGLIGLIGLRNRRTRRR